MNEIGRKTPSRRETRSSRSGPPGGLRILAHGRPGAVQVRDVSGRIRWLDGGAFGNVVTWVIGLPGFEEELAKAVDEAVGWEESGNLNRALPSWKKVLELLMGPGSSHMDRQKRFMALTKLAVLSSQLNRTDEAISYWCDALELSEKLYGIHSINNFNIINSIAVIFDERGDYGQAAPLYRRSLAGRLRIRGPDHADTLMSMQELGMANWRLNRATAARKLLEKACLGYENLRPRDDGKMVFMVLLNLASVYGSLGMKTSAEALLLNGIPRMRAALGLQDKVLAYALGSYLQQRQGTALPPTILDTIQAVRQKSDSEHWAVVAEALAAFHCQNRRYRDGLRLYQEVIQRHHQQHQVPNDPRLVKTIHAVAHCHELLGELVEAEAACRKWASLVAPGTPTHAFATQSLDKIRRRLDNISTERQKWDLPPYTSPSTLPAPRPCAVCKNHTNQLCPDCQIFPLCPISDSPSCTEKHKSCSQCVPSLLPSESQTALLDPAFPAPDLAARFQTLFAGDEHLRHTFLSGNPSTSTQPPRLITTQALFVAIRPRCIATVRLPKRRDRLVSFWFNTRCNADVRIRWRSGGPWGVDAAMVCGGGGWKDLRGAAGMGMMYLYPSDDDYWLLVAPGEETLGKARQERAHVFPDEDGGKGGLTAEGVPDREMLEWLQLVDGDDDGEWNRNSGGGLGLKLELVLVMMEWEC
ncbi:uncharacterized protein B0T15DRAFT_533865 [Chaetomium strumarium]|uniref:Uncharacterized protein n=1 Tax=Chaetomium strumarium TaxID=1170767 RepID=A0AAJ0GTK7_9PEZI|nr:hypothetical protein B0T15DRAFT_533865 [Chaetomium strumarium]